MSQIPIVDYLSLEDPAHLVANECTECQARFFDRRNACGKCGNTEFNKAKVDSKAKVGGVFYCPQSSTQQLWFPYISGIVETDDNTTVRSNIM